MNRYWVIGSVIVILVVGVFTASAQDSAQIAITGADGNIYIYDMADGELTPITTDASLDSPHRFYSWPTWSSDGQLAFFGVNLDEDNLFRLGIFIRQVGREPKGVFASEAETFTYAYWAPGDCPDGNCRDLAVLYANAAGLATRLVRSGETFEIIEIAEGGPFYWDWSPDGSTMFWARFGQTLELYDVASEEVTEVLPESQSGFQQAVDWSPVDDRLLASVSSGRDVELIVIDGDERVILASGLTSGVAYEWSPDGEMAAYLDRGDGSLHVVNSRTAAEVISLSDQAIVFLWSPDGSKLAYVTIASQNNGPGAKLMQQGVPALQWNVYDLASETRHALSTFIPTEDMIYYLIYFDQFARSHRLWSPDSHYLVYGEVITEGGQEVVTLLNVETNTPETIAPGTIGIFSW